LGNQGKSCDPFNLGFNERYKYFMLISEVVIKRGARNLCAIGNINHICGANSTFAKECFGCAHDCATSAAMDCGLVLVTRTRAGLGHSGTLRGVRVDDRKYRGFVKLYLSRYFNEY
jgi:hypothetical protein